MEKPQQNSGIVGAALWMAVVSLLLFWIPPFGTLIGGFVGGWKAGKVGTALLAALLPAFLLGLLSLLLAGVLSGLPLVGAIFGMGSFVLAMLNAIPLMIGAFIGAVMR